MKGMDTRNMYTGLQLAEKVLAESGKPMSPEEIWTYAVEHGYASQCGISGKTPYRTIGSQLYINIRDKPESRFQQVSSRPPRFGLRSRSYTTDQTPSTEPKREFKERDLHPLLVAFVYSDDHFKGYTRTIYHESSVKTKKNAEKWMHPDLVSVKFPFIDFDPQTVELGRNTGQSGVRLFSFEMKVNVTGANVRECFFQAVSNSTWANEGYLVALSFNDDALTQLARLSASFGIGVIRLDPDDVHQSEILFPSRDNDFVDLAIIDDLSAINPDFSRFIRAINDSMKTQRAIYSDYDTVLSDDALKAYIAEKRISRRLNRILPISSAHRYAQSSIRTIALVCSSVHSQLFGMMKES